MKVGIGTIVYFIKMLKPWICVS